MISVDLTLFGGITPLRPPQMDPKEISFLNGLTYGAIFLYHLTLKRQIF